MLLRLSLLALIGLSLIGCETAKKVEQQKAYLEETEIAVEKIAEAVTGQPLSAEERKRLQDQIKKDPEAQSAMQAIADSHTKPLRMKYSPATGKRYAGHIDVDPETGVKLLWLDEE